MVTTGYPAEMLEVDLDLEADLGVDSVQRAEIWVSLVTEHGLDQETRPEGPRTIANLAKTLAGMAASRGETSGKKSEAGTVKQPEAAAATASYRLPDPADVSACHLFAAGSRFLDESRMKPFECRRVTALVEDLDNGAASRLKKKLSRRGIEEIAFSNRYGAPL